VGSRPQGGSEIPRGLAWHKESVDEALARVPVPCQFLQLARRDGRDRTLSQIGPEQLADGACDT